jgi:uncharacterized protein (TIGR02246 family)
MTRSSVFIPVLAISLTLPAAAEQISKQEAHQAGEAIVQAYNNAGQAKDAAGLAAVYTEDAILVMPEGPLVGRAAIQKYFTEAFKVFTLDSAKLDQVRTIANGQVMLRVGSFSGTVHGAGGVSQSKATGRPPMCEKTANGKSAWRRTI